MYIGLRVVSVCGSSDPKPLSRTFSDRSRIEALYTLNSPLVVSFNFDPKRLVFRGADSD